MIFQKQQTACKIKNILKRCFNIFFNIIIFRKKDFKENLTKINLEILVYDNFYISPNQWLDLRGLSSVRSYKFDEELFNLLERLDALISPFFTNDSPFKVKEEIILNRLIDFIYFASDSGTHKNYGIAVKNQKNGYETYCFYNDISFSNNITLRLSNCTQVNIIYYYMPAEDYSFGEYVEMTIINEENNIINNLKYNATFGYFIRDICQSKECDEVILQQLKHALQSIINSFEQLIKYSESNHSRQRF